MQSLQLERVQAEELRKQGISYSEIAKIVPVAKSSLSLWLRDIPLSREQRSALYSKGHKAGIKARRQQTKRKLHKLTKEVNSELPTLLKDPFFCMGLSLYWAEGEKQKPWAPSISCAFGNSDHNTILLMRKWFIKYGQVFAQDLTYRLYIHDSADTQKALNAWSAILSINPKSIPITIKRHIVHGRHKHPKYKGLIQLSVRRSTLLNRRIGLWTQGAADHFAA